MMKKLLFIVILLPSLVVAQSPELKKFYDAAISAYKKKDYGSFYKNITEAGRLHPYHQGILYLRAKAAAIQGKKEEAITCLQAALQIYAPYQLEGVADFERIKDEPEFGALLSMQKELLKPVIHADTAFVLKDRSLHTEGIDYDAENKIFYVGSLHKRKIILRSASGVVKDFCPSGFEGIAGIFGIKVDRKRNMLWACSSPLPEMENYDTLSRSAVYQFDLSTGKMLGKYLLAENGKDGLFGDLVLSPEGEVYVSDSRNNRIMKVNEKKKTLDLLYTSPEFWNLQGLAFSANGDFLFIADYIRGVFRFNTKTRELTTLQPPKNFSMKGIDGLYFYKKSLVAIQNGVTPNRLTRYDLDDTFSSIIGVEIIDKAHPAYGEPTLGTLSGDHFYYIANSQWDGYDDQHKIKPTDQLKDIVILRCQPGNRP